MIEFRNVWVQYREPAWALSDVSLTVPRGQFCLVTGHSGSGKTTLLKTLTRELSPSRGEVSVAGADILAIPPKRLCELRRTMGVVFQDFRLLRRRRVFENVAVPLRAAGLPEREIRRKVFVALRLVGLHDRLSDQPADLSYGEQQRVAIARALVNAPPLLLADEPTGNLDHGLAREIFGLLKEINRQGTTVIVCTHDRELVREFGERIILLHRGRVRAGGTA